MWIITKYSGAINTEFVTRIKEDDHGTIVYYGNLAYLVSEKHIMDDLITALRQGRLFLEVE